MHTYRAAYTCTRDTWNTLWGTRTADQCSVTARAQRQLRQVLLSSYSGCQGLSGGRCAQLSAAHAKPGADSTTCSAQEWRDTGEVFSALQSGDDSATGGSTGQMAAAVDARPRRKTCSAGNRNLAGILLSSVWPLARRMSHETKGYAASVPPPHGFTCSVRWPRAAAQVCQQHTRSAQTGRGRTLQVARQTQRLPGATA